MQTYTDDRSNAIEYDIYEMYLPLYYSGHFSGPDISGMKALTFDGFTDNARVDTGNSTTFLDTANKKVTLGNSATVRNQYTLNQSQQNYANNETSTGGGDQSQSFLVNAGNGGRLKSVTLWWNDSVAGFSNMTISVYSIPAGNQSTSGWPGATLLGSLNTGAVSFTAGTMVTQTFDISSLGIILVPGQYYGVVCQPSRNSSSGTITTWLNSGNLYANGADRSIGGNYDDCMIIDAVAFNTSSNFLTATKVMTFTPTNAKLWYSMKSNTYGSITPYISADGGTHWESPTQTSTRTDPKDGTLTEYEYTLASFAYPSTNLKLKFALATTDAGVTPELVRYGCAVA
ncbi:MAG: hypothetical protein RO469_05480 [Thermincola sp.]|nr:hypothetical protein [Thermincola sp.]MDT3704730.1 hypothetical protein [Thermincola sp.]